MDFKAYRYFKKLYKEIAERKSEGLLKSSSALTIERLNAKFLTSYRKLLKSKFNHYSSFFTSNLRKKYLNFINGGYEERNKGLKGYYINKLKPQFKDELINRINFSLSLIKTQDKKTMEQLSERFLNWLNNETMQGNKESLAQTLSIHKTQQKNDKHYKFILKDQTQKMFTSFDNIIANEYKAIGFYWRTRRDKRVVGNPSGLYPKVIDEEAHGNHYKRAGKFYFYENTQYLKQGLFDKGKIEYAKFNDGMPGAPIGCRCYAENVYNIEDVPSEYLTKKGKQYLETL